MPLLVALFVGHCIAFAPAPQIKVRSVQICMSKTGVASSSRADFISKTIASSMAIAMPTVAHAFDGGVGGLGKSRPLTGVVFRDPEAATSNGGDDITNELLAPDGTAAFVTFQAPWVSLYEYINIVKQFERYCLTFHSSHCSRVPRE